MNTRMKKLISIVLVLTLGLAAEVSKADFTFGEPTNLGPIVNSSDDDGSPSISADGLQLYWHSLGDLWVTTRATIDDDWGEPVDLGPIVNSLAVEVTPSISADGLELYFCDWGGPLPGGLGESDLWVTTRPTKDDEWGEPVNLGPTVNSSANDGTPEISSDGLELYFESDRPGGYGFDDIYVTTRATTEDDWGTPVNLGPTVNGSLWEHCPTISADGLTLFFDLDIPAGDLMVTRRATKDDDWGEPVNLGHSASGHWASDISADDFTLYFTSEQDGGQGGSDIWQVPIIPVFDFSGDGKVDNADICIMGCYWNMDEPLCDIGPTPLGDGIVDAQDLMVLAEYLTEEKVIAAIKELYNQATLACSTGDPELYLSIFTEDAVVLAPESAAVIGKAELRPIIEGLFGQFDLGLPYTVDEVGVPGDWAFVRSSFQYSMTPKEGGETTTSPGKQLDILKRQADGSWKIYLQCWNYGGTPTEAKMAGITCGPGVAKPAREEDAEAIVTDIIDVIKLAYTTGDIDLYVGNYTADGVQMVADGPTLIGREQIRASMQMLFDLFSIDVPIYLHETGITGEWGFGRCTATHSLTPKEGGETTSMYSKVLSIFKRQADGSWKVYIDCWNSNVPPTVEE